MKKTKLDDFAGLPPYTQIGGPYNEAYVNPKYLERYKRRKARQAKAEKEAQEKAELQAKDQGQEM